jgi:hypothetical protein
LFLQAVGVWACAPRAFTKNRWPGRRFFQGNL